MCRPIGKLDHLADALDGKARLEGAGGVVKSAVEDAAVVGGLVLTGRGFFFQHGDVRAGVLAQQLPRGGEAHNTAADDQCGWGFQLAPP